MSEGISDDKRKRRNSILRDTELVTLYVEGKRT